MTFAPFNKFMRWAICSILYLYMDNIFKSKYSEISEWLDVEIQYWFIAYRQLRLTIVHFVMIYAYT